MDTWEDTEHLVLDRDGVLWIKVRTDEDLDLRRLGPVEDADVPEDLEAERAGLLDLWLDMLRCDDRAEALEVYWRGVGALRG